MGAAGARAQKPVGSAAWISTEKENVTQLVDQEMEEIEFPVQFEMEWLNEHMAEVFSNSQFNFAEAFKTPGKMRGKTPRTLRKRDATESRVPLSEIFSSVKKNPAENKFSRSPAVQRPPTKAITAPSAGTPSAQAKSKAPAQPQYPDLFQNINSFSQYNTDSGYHGMEDDEGDDDELVLTQVAPESQLSTQPIEFQPVAADDAGRRSSIGRRTTDASFHSAREERLRGETVEPMNVDSPKQTHKEPPPVEEPAKESHPAEDTIMENKPADEQEAEEPEPVTEKETDAPAKDATSPVKAAALIPSPKENKERTKDEEHHKAESQKETQEEPEKDEMALDNLDDIASQSDDSPERPPVRKSSLSFASLPAREPLGSKTLGGSRLSRTSHLGSIKPTAGPSYSGRQTGHRMTQAQDENSQADKMDVDEAKTNEESDVDAKATKLHNKSSTQRLHEKISMLGKMQPSRPTKSIPAAAASAQVSYPELPAMQPEARKESSNSKQRETTPQPQADDDDWIKPLSSPFQAYPTTQPTASKLARPATSHAPELSSPIKSTAHELTRTHTTQATEISRQKSATPIFSSPQRFGHTKSASVNIDSKMTTTPIGSPRGDGPLSASKSRLQSIVRSAKGLFTSSGGISAAARVEASSPDERRAQLQRANMDMARTSQRPLSVFSPPRQEGRRTRSSTEREERRKQQEIDDRKREEEVTEKSRQEEKLRMQKTTRERAHTESEARSALPSSPLRAPPSKSREPEPAEAPKSIPAPQANKANRPTKPTREPQQKPKPQPVSIRVGSALSRQMPLAPMASSAESSIPTPAPPSATKAPSLKKKASNQSLHTTSSNSSFKSSASSQTQRKAQLASERKREQEDREARRKEEQRREMERKRAGQQSRAEAERQRQAEDPKKAAQMQAIEKRRLENARRLERQGSQQPEAPTYTEKPAQAQRDPAQPARPASRIGSVLGRTINPPAPNPAKPPKRGMDDEASRPTTAKPGAMQPSGETKRRRTDDEQQQQQNRTSMRPTMAPPIRQSNIRKEPAKKPSMYGNQHSAAPQPGSSIFKSAQPQRPGHPMDMAKYASGKIPFAESSNAGPSQPHRTPGTSKQAPKKSPNYPNGENINLPEIATDSEDEDSETEMLPVPNWAQPKQLETLLRDQEGMEVDSIFGPIAPFSLEETFKADKKIKKFRDRTSSANWAGPDGLTQEEIRKDVAERQRLRLNGGWTFGM